MRKNSSKARHADELMNMLDTYAKRSQAAIHTKARELHIDTKGLLERDIVKEIRRHNES